MRSMTRMGGYSWKEFELTMDGSRAEWTIGVRLVPERKSRKIKLWDWMGCSKKI